MPVNARVYSPTSHYPLPTKQIGQIHHVACQHSETSYMSPSSDRIRAGVKHYGSQLPVWGSEEPGLDEHVYKTGQTTGTTLGEILAYVDRDGFCGVMYNQCFAVMDCDFGDSGAPVYWIDWVKWWPNLYQTVELGQIEVAVLKGVLFAGSPAGGWCVFSPIDLTLDDLEVWPLPGPFG